MYIYIYIVWGKSPWQSDQWAMLFEAGFRVNCICCYCFVIFLCHVDSPNPCPWDIRVLDLFMYNARGASAAAFSLGYH